jgi:RimK family alpha-L-glutamate ligase
VVNRHCVGAPAQSRSDPVRVAIVAHRRNETNRRLAAARCRGVEWVCLTPTEALDTLVPGDVALGRLDVLPTVDGVDDGLWSLGELAAAGVRVLNGPSALLAAHDKLLTARLLHGAGLPHPLTRLAVPSARPPRIDAPVVVKPRFGSWGRGVVLCETGAALQAHLRELREEPWYRRHGALLQELVEPLGYDLRVLVAGGSVVGAIRRVAADGEWRTNIALGGHRERAVPPPEACALALQAAEAADIDLVGVDLLPTADGWTVVELNGAVDFTSDYSLDRDVFAATGFELARLALGCPRMPARRTAAAPAWADRGSQDELGVATLVE